jgi:hypothetical protein
MTRKVFLGGPGMGKLLASLLAAQAVALTHEPTEPVLDPETMTIVRQPVVVVEDRDHAAAMRDFHPPPVPPLVMFDEVVERRPEPMFVSPGLPVNTLISTRPHAHHWTELPPERIQTKAEKRRARQMERGQLKATNGVDMARRLDL